MKLTTEQLTKAKTAATAEELLTFAKAEGLDMTEQEAADLFAKLNCQGELADVELGNVSGGVICGSDDEEDDYKEGERILASVNASCPECDSRFYEIMNINYMSSRPYKVRCCGCGYAKKELEHKDIMQKA